MFWQLVHITAKNKDAWRSGSISIIGKNKANKKQRESHMALFIIRKYNKF